MARFGFPLMALLGLAAAMAAGPAMAQQSATAPALAPAPSTSAFLGSVAAGNQFEIDSSKLALSRAKSDAVKKFAQRMVEDHAEAGAKFKQAVADAKLPPPSEELDASHQAVLDDLEAKDGPAFDKAYIAAQHKAHVETVDLFKAYARSGDNGRMKLFANDLLPTLQAHLNLVSKMR